MDVYGFDLPALKLIQRYLRNFGVPQECILGSSLCNIFLCDLPLKISETNSASYADDSTPYLLGDSIDNAIKSLEDDSINLFESFPHSQMKGNNDKCYLITNNQT